ncbi:MAG: beta-galactosidase [Patescibacteria group bacterium]|nr:beta-galactosidase [Patescibacteria group bacterium]
MNYSALLKLSLGIVLVIIVAIFAFLLVGWPSKTPGVTYGMTFSRPYALELGLDPDKTLSAALDDVGIRRFRIAAYWKLLEPKEGEWDFSDLDKDIAAIGERDGKVVLALGEKLPRWPECWGPDWYKGLPRKDQRAKTLRYIEKVVERYRDNPTVAAWQVENEPHFRYGDCPAPDYLFIRQETEFVRSLDPTRPIQTTDSGELSSWLTLGVFVDKLGISVYRVVRNPILGDMNLHYWFLPPYVYKRKALLARPFGVTDVYVSEFQMEPWSNKSLDQTPIEDQLSSIDIKQMRANFHFAERMGFKEIDFWGIEWWVWMKEKKDHPEFIDEAKSFWAEHR